MGRPRVVLDARITRQMSVGMIAYVHELLRRLPAAAPDIEFVALSNVEFQETALHVRPLPETMAANGSIAEQFALPSLMRTQRSGPTLFHLMSVYGPRLAPKPYVYTIHDLIHRRFAHYFKWKVRPYYAWVAGPVARGARAVITDAKATVPDLQRYLGVSATAARVVPLGVDERFRLSDGDRQRLGAIARSRFDLRSPFLMCAGNHREHKNLETLAAAWQRVELPCDLVLTEDMPFSFDLDRYAKSNGRIVRAGHVSDEELIALYAGCAATVQPSLYEGFGLSVLEGMAAGAPVVVAQTPALLEVAGDAALTFPPLDAAALAGAIEAVLAGGPTIAGIVARGRERAAYYSWERTAALTAAVYRECLAA